MLGMPGWNLRDKKGCDRDACVGPEFLTDFGDTFQRHLKTFLAAGHAALFPNEQTELFVEAVYSAGTIDVDELLDAFLHR